MWNKSSNPKKEWEDLKTSDVFTWLNVPKIHYENSYSYFTELGYKLFMINTYPFFIKYLAEENIRIDKYKFEEQLDILYEDEHQIGVKKENI